MSKKLDQHWLAIWTDDILFFTIPWQWKLRVRTKTELDARGTKRNSWIGFVLSTLFSGMWQDSLRVLKLSSIAYDLKIDASLVPSYSSHYFVELRIGKRPLSVRYFTRLHLLAFHSFLVPDRLIAYITEQHFRIVTLHWDHDSLAGYGTSVSLFSSS